MTGGQPNHVDATFYAQVEPDWSGYTTGAGDRVLRGAKAVAITQKRRPSWSSRRA